MYLDGLISLVKVTKESYHNQVMSFISNQISKIQLRKLFRLTVSLVICQVLDAEEFILIHI